MRHRLPIVKLANPHDHGVSERHAVLISVGGCFGAHSHKLTLPKKSMVLVQTPFSGIGIKLGQKPNVTSLVRPNDLVFKILITQRHFSFRGVFQFDLQPNRGNSASVHPSLKRIFRHQTSYHGDRIACLRQQICPL